MVRVATSAKFPATQLALADIGIFTNLEDADLVANATSGAATFDVDDASPFAVGMWLSGRSADGFEIVQVTAVDLALNRVTITRAKDGTIAVAHPQGRTFKASIPAVALNQMRDDLVAHALFLTPVGGSWTPGSVIFIGATNNLHQDNANFFWDDANNRLGIGTAAAPQFTLDVGGIVRIRSANRLTFGGTGAADNDVGVGRQAASVLEETGSLAGSVRFGQSGAGASFLALRAAAADANAYLQVTTVGLSTGAGGASAVDATLGRQAASVWEATGSLVGSVRFGMSGAGTPFWALRAAAADANPFLTATTLGLAYGLGAASATDLLLARQASSLLAVTGALAGDVRVGMTGAATPDVSLRVAAANAQPDAQLIKDRLNFGLGGASAIDASLVRLAAATLGGPSDLGLSLGSATVRLLNAVSNTFAVYAASADANPTARLATSILAFGAGGASATDVAYARQAASVVELTGSLAGSVRYGMSGAGDPFLALRLAAADAQPAATLLEDRVAFGAGGASVVDFILLRTGANTGTLSGTLRPSATATYNLGSTTEVWTNVWARILNLDNQGAGADVVLQANNAAQRANLAGHLSPSADSTWDLGEAAVRWANGYFDNVDTAALTSGHILPAADNTYDLGSASLRWRDVYATGSSYRVITAQGDANPTARLGSALLAFGAGGASATDVQYARQAASVVELTGSLAGSVRYGMSGAGSPFWALRLAAADANPLIQATTAGIAFGAGGASAVDVNLIRVKADALGTNNDFFVTPDGSTSSPGFTALYRATDHRNLIVTTTNGDALAHELYSVEGSNDRRARFFLDDTNGVFGLEATSSSGTPNFVLGIGGVEVMRATDDGQVRFPVQGSLGGVLLGGEVLHYRQNANIVEVTGTVAGSFRYGLSGANTPFLALRNAAADANAALLAVKAGLNLGAGGASAADLFLERVVPTANILFHVGAGAAGATGVWIDVTTPGVVLRSPNNDYWRVTIDNTGALTTTNIGASLP